ncbi:hypothetical protein LguiB_020890 [Lonicera macranthoides]
MIQKLILKRANISHFALSVSLSSLSRTLTSVATPPPIARNHRPSLHRLTHSSAPFLFLCRRAFSSTSSLLLYPSLQVPDGGCYRLIDIPMSNCINSGMNRIYVLA